MALTADTAPLTVAAHFARLLTEYATAHGEDVPGLLSGAGAAPDCLDDPDGRIPFSLFDLLCRRLAEARADLGLGLRLGLAIKPGHFGPHGFGLISCATVRELLHHSMRYSGLVMDACRNELVFGDTEVVRYWRSNLPEGQPVGRLQDDLNMAAWVTLARWITGRPDIRPGWVSFRHEAPEDVRDYEAIFGCPLRFGAADTAIAFDPAWLDLTLPQANPAVRRMMDDLCARQLAALAAAREPDWLRACKKQLVLGFETGVPELDAVAATLAMSARELQRLLAGRGLNFRDLADQLRCAMAKTYLRDATLSLVDVAFLLGFSEQSAFQRAFKRWTGLTPKAFREGGEQTATG